MSLRSTGSVKPSGFWLVTGLAFAMPVIGCDCSDGNVISIVITAPTDGQEFTTADDTNSERDGVQITATVSAANLGAGSVVELYNTNSGGTETMVGMQEASGTVELTFEDVDLTAGANTLEVRLLDSLRVFESVTVMLDDDGVIMADADTEPPPDDDEPVMPVDGGDSMTPDPCGDIAFITPAGGSDATIGSSSDTDGTACGEGFTTDVTVSAAFEDATELTLTVNGTDTVMATVMSGSATFTGVALANRGDTANTLSVQADGCDPVAFGGDVFVDCDGPACAFLTPATGDEATLNAANDGDAAAGLQTTITIQTDASGLGQDVSLDIGGTVNTATPDASGVATFANVTVPEGTIAVSATCTDAEANPTVAAATWTVDVTPCTVAITSPTDGSTENAAMTGGASVINVQATVTGDNCSSSRVAFIDDATCATISGLVDPIDAGDLPDLSLPLSLENSGTRSVCVEITDSAGNVSTDSVGLTFNNGGPVLGFLGVSTGSPDAITAIQITRDGGAAVEADQDQGTTDCDLRRIRVSCRNLADEVDADLEGQPVQLRQSADRAAFGSTANCTNGVATFEGLPAIPSDNSGGVLFLFAEMTSSAGVSAETAQNLAITADCEPPVLNLSQIRCDGVYRLSSDDEDGTNAGLQTTLRIGNTTDPAPTDVTVTITEGTDGAGTVVSTTDSNVHDEPNDETDFDCPGLNCVSLTTGTGGGTRTLTATSSDAVGNSTSVSCSFGVGEIPTVSTVAAQNPPSNGSVYTRSFSPGSDYRDNTPPSNADDCNGGTPELEIFVTATATGTVEDTPATITVGSLAPVTARMDDSGNVVCGDQGLTCCVPVEDGSSVTITVAVEDPFDSAATGQNSTTVAVDGTPPANPAVVSNTDVPTCRGDITVTYDIADATTKADISGWEIRCSNAPITTSQEWFDAEVLNVTPTAQPDESLQFALAGRPVTRNCAIRGYDQAGAYTPLGANQALTGNALSEVYLDGPGVISDDFSRVTSIGSVNGPDAPGDTPDARGDFLVHGSSFVSFSSRTALYLGAEGGPGSEALTIEIANGFGAKQAVGIGDFNGDGLNDFAVPTVADGPSGFNAGDAVVFIYLGRTDSDWAVQTAASPLTPNGQTGDCQADACIVLDGLPGWSLTPLGDFNGDGLDDLGVSKYAASNGAVVVLGTNSLSPVADLGTTQGACLDARAAPAADACGGGSYAPTPGFDIQTGFAVSAVTSTGTATGETVSDMFLAGLTPSLHRVRGRAHSGGAGLDVIAAGDLVTVDDGTAAPFSTFTASLDAAQVIGDFNGDGELDIAISRTAAGPGGIAMFFGQGAAAYDTDERLLMNNAANGATDGFGFQLGSGFHPAFGVGGGDFDGDGNADLLSGEVQSNGAEGAVRVFFGRTDSEFFPTNEQDADFIVNNAVLGDDGTAEVPYARSPDYVDVDGDGLLDIVFVEPAFSTTGGIYDGDADTGRVVILGMCNGI